MKTVLVAAAVMAFVLCSCGQPQTVAPTEQSTPVAAPAPASDPVASTASPATPRVPMRNFAPVKIGKYDVQPMFEEEIKDGHFNIRVSGGEFNAVRIWVGPEDATGVVVVKTELENDYQHGHVEVPNPIPADAKLWIEIESPDGSTAKGSTPLEMQS